MSIESYTAVATQTREATEKSVEAWKRGARTFTDELSTLTALPTIDPREPVARYLEFVQQYVDVQRDLLTSWAELIGSVSQSMRHQVTEAGNAVISGTDQIADLATGQAKQAEQLAQKQAEIVDEAEKEQARLARKAERDAAKAEREAAREPYEGKTKAELADLLADRSLPKTGTVDELIDRLVSADA